MSRRDIEELIKQLQDVAKDCPERVSLERSVFDEVVTNLGRLEQALDNRPSLIKKLNEKIIKLESELEILRNETRVNELEKKVQRLEGELQRSYATKNFTLKNGLLEIEKAYRDFISSSPAVQSLWDEITLLLVEDKESLPQHILARRNTLTRSHDAEAAPVSDSPLGPQITVEGSETGPPGTLSYVQQQVDKFKDYTFTPGTHDPHDPNHPANLHALYSQHHLFPGATPSGSYGGAPDARAGEAMDDRPTGLDERMTQIRAQYNDSAGGGPVPALEPHWGSVVPAPSPLRPVSLFSSGGEGKPPDASAALEACRDELNASLEHLRALFAQYDWAPTPLPAVGAAAASGASGAATQRQQPSAVDGADGAGADQRGLPDASAFTSMADSLEVSVEKLRQYFSQFQWVPGAAAGSSGSGATQGPGGAVVPDARYFDSQADVILASVQHLRRQFQEAAEAAAAAAAAAGGSGGGSYAGTESGGPSPVIPDARYFETQADVIAASVNELLRLYERSAAAAPSAAANGGTSPGQGPWAGASAEAEAAVSGSGRAAVTPDARAGDALADEYDASVRPLVDLFSSFLAHLEATRGLPGASGPWPMWWRGAPKDGAAAATAAGGADATGESGGTEGAEAGPAPPPDAAELLRLFAKYARVWPTTAAAAGALRMTPVRAGSGTPGAVPAFSPMGSMAAGAVALPPETRPSGELHLVFGGEGYARGAGASSGATDPAGTGATAGAGVPAGQASPAPAVRFHIRINATDASGGAAVTARLSPAPSGANLAAGQLQSPPPLRQQQRVDDGSDAVEGAEAGNADAEGRATVPAVATTPGPAGGRSSVGAPVDVLLSSLEARHGRGLAASPEAVAVWRDLLMLLGVDPNSRPLPTHGPSLPTPSQRTTTPRQPQAGPTSKGAVSLAAGTGLASGTQGPGEASEASPATAQQNREGPVLAAGTAGAIASGSHAVVGGGGGNQCEDAGSGEAGGEAGQALGRRGSAASSSSDLQRSAPAEAGEGVLGNHSAGETADGEASPSAAAAATAEGGELAVAQRHTADDAALTAPSVEAGSEGMQTEGGELPGARQGLSEGPAAPADDTVAAAAAVYERAPRSRDHSTDGDGDLAGPGGDMQGDDAPPGDVAAREDARPAAGAEGEQHYEDAAAAVAAAAEPILASEGPGLVAGGVRFQITLSEITPAVDPQSPSVVLPSEQLQQQQSTAAEPEQQLVQFRANVTGVDPEAAAAAVAELHQLRQVRHSLSEQLAATQELVRGLNRQLAVTLENRDDLAVRVETLGTELSAARADAAEARHESDMFMRELVDAKVQLAEVQGEYMQVYLALKKALGNEKDMIAKIDELERILAVVGPGDVSVDDEYGSTVGQVSAMVTPREGLDGGGTGEAPSPVVAVQQQLGQHNAATGETGTPRAASAGAEGNTAAIHDSPQGMMPARGSSSSSRGPSGGGSASGRKSLGDAGVPVAARRSVSGGGRSSSGGSGYNGGSGGGSGR